MITLDHIRAAVTLPDFDAQAVRMEISPVPRLRTRPEEPHKAGVLVLLFPHPDSRWHVLLTKRTESLRGHSGQVSFPGGRRDEHDTDFTATALRETCEELGLCDDITLLGTLTPIYIPPSHFDVFPTVGYIPYPPTLTPNPDEVDEVFSLALDDLIHPSTKRDEERDFQGYTVTVPYYAVHGHKVWGATALMLSELEQRLKKVLEETTPS